MSGISPSLLHSIKLKQSAPVKELVAFLMLGGPGKGMLSFLYTSSRVWDNLKKEIEFIFKNLCAILLHLVNLLDISERGGRYN